MLAIAQQDIINSPSNEQNFESKSSASNRKTREESTEEYAFGKVDFIPFVVENLDEMEEYLAPFGYSVQEAADFIKQYNENCVEFFKAIKSLRFEALEGIWVGFWQNSMKENSIGEG